MDLFKQAQQPIYTSLAIKHPYYIKNHQVDTRSKRIAARIARKKLRTQDYKEIREWD